ncbi:unnamed protein product, partial [Dicrocoelium dendriticum]
VNGRFVCRAGEFVPLKWMGVAGCRGKEETFQHDGFHMHCHATSGRVPVCLLNQGCVSVYLVWTAMIHCPHRQLAQCGATGGLLIQLGSDTRDHLCYSPIRSTSMVYPPRTPVAF